MPSQKSWRWSLRPILDFDSDKTGHYNHRDDLESTVQIPNFRLVMARYAYMRECMLHIAPASFIYTWEYVSQGNA